MAQQQHHAAPTSRPIPSSTLLPLSPTRQVLFLSTGALSGLCSSTAISLSTFRLLSYTHLPAFLAAAYRFWAFDLARGTLERAGVSDIALRGGLAGAVGGLTETLLMRVGTAMRSSSLAPLRPHTLARAALEQSSLLFLCFGSYTYLSTRLSPDRQPPTPLAYCFALGAAAGAFGVATLTAVKTRSARMAIRAIPIGALRVGTVISVQVTSAAWGLEKLEKAYAKG